MNERIKQLAEQAGFAYEPSPTLQKFAELIVQECIQVCEPILDEPYEDMTEFGKGLVEGQDVAIERIKEHFGVEE
jgi:hypothetical protein